MNIHKNNYEAYFLDYHEGTLSPQEVADLFLFLSQHPEFKKELEDFEHIVLDDFSFPIFENKDSLKKNITVDNREDYFIRAVEGSLDPFELALLDDFLKKYPEFITAFQLFQKTKLQVDPSIVFENKTTLKQPAAIPEVLLISYVEGLLKTKEQAVLEQQLAVNPELQKTFNTYLSTKAVADLSVIYPNKQELKRKEKKVIPLYYYTVSIAASIVLLLGLFFLLTNNTGSEQRLADQKSQPTTEGHKRQAPATIIDQKENRLTNVYPSLNKIVAVKNTKTIVKRTDSENVPLIDTNRTPVAIPLIETDPLTGNSIAIENHIAANEQTIIPPTDSTGLQQNKNTTPAIAKINTHPEAAKAPGFVSLRDLFAEKMKEKLRGKGGITAENKTNASKKINGWDIAGIFAKGLSRMTGQKIEIKPKFNEEGDLKAYAFSAGKLEFSRIK